MQVRKLLALGADVNFKNELLQTPLLLAAETGHLETLRAIVGALIPYVYLFVCAYMHTLPRLCDMRERTGGAKGQEILCFFITSFLKYHFLLYYHCDIVTNSLSPIPEPQTEQQNQTLN